MALSEGLTMEPADKLGGVPGVPRAPRVLGCRGLTR